LNFFDITEKLVHRQR